MLQRIDVQDLISHFVNGSPFLDVRAPIEFNLGSLPGAINLPILNDEERDKIGKVYKQHGNEKAVQLGYRLISGDVKEARLQSWIAQIQKDPRTILYCFRGGQRSQITQSWLAQAGIQRPLIDGGFKKARQFLLQNLVEYPLHKTFFVLTGATGSGKTVLLRDLEKFYPVLDLERRANHRGSAYGNLGTQPSQINFENQLSVDFLKLHDFYLRDRPQLNLLLEDESRLIGARYLPENLFLTLRSSPVLKVERSLEERVNQIYQEYIIEAFDFENEEQNQKVFEKYQGALNAIQKRLGGLKHQEITKLYQESLVMHQKGHFEAHKNWIRELLVHYYDPMYRDSFAKRNPQVLFQGSHQEIRDYLSDILLKT